MCLDVVLFAMILTSSDADSVVYAMSLASRDADGVVLAMNLVLLAGFGYS